MLQDERLLVLYTIHILWSLSLPRGADPQKVQDERGRERDPDCSPAFGCPASSSDCPPAHNSNEPSPSNRHRACPVQDARAPASPPPPASAAAEGDAALIGNPHSRNAAGISQPFPCRMIIGLIWKPPIRISIRKPSWKTQFSIFSEEVVEDYGDHGPPCHISLVAFSAICPRSQYLFHLFCTFSLCFTIFFLNLV